MPSVSTSTSSPSYPEGYSASSLTDILDALEISMDEGSIITADGFNDLIEVFNAWRQHTHTVDDVQFIAYGSTPGRSNTTVSATTSTVTGTSALTNTVAEGDSITAAGSNTVISAINAIRSHSHSLDDGI